MQTHCKEGLKASIKEAMPAWLPRAGLKVADNLSRQYRVYFPCPCHGSVKPRVKIPIAGATHQQMVNKLVQNVTADHRLCYEHWAADQTVTKTAGEQVAAAAGGTASVAAANRQKRKLEVQNELLTAKAQRAAAAIATQTDAKRQAALAEQHRLDIDPENKELLSIPNKSTALTSPGVANPGGLIDAMKYWARGSLAAILQLIMALIAHFGLEQEVRQQLGAEQETLWDPKEFRLQCTPSRCCAAERVGLLVPWVFQRSVWARQNGAARQ
jgi:hypothetical protein